MKPCPPCKHDCAAIWHVRGDQCVHVEPLRGYRMKTRDLVDPDVHTLSDQAIAWAMLAICIALGIFALVGWL